MKTAPSPTRAATEQALDNFWDTIPPLWGQVRGHVRAAASEKYRLGVEQFQVLRLVRAGKASASEIAAARNISRPAVSQAVDGLVQRGLLTRTQDADDRRHNQLALTESGQAVVESVFEDARAWMRLKLARLTPAELHTVTQAMRTLHKLLD